MRAKIIAVDFDGTLIEEGKWPDIGETNQKVLDYCKSEKAKGARIILWTNRTGEPLATAVRWCENNGLQLDAVNANLPEVIEFFGTDTRKIYADEFIDDRMAKGFELPYISDQFFYCSPEWRRLRDFVITKDQHQQYETKEQKCAMGINDLADKLIPIIFVVGVAVAIILAFLMRP